MWVKLSNSYSIVEHQIMNFSNIAKTYSVSSKF